MNAEEIKDKMVEHKHYNVLRDETEYRWNFGIHHVADKYDTTKGDEAGWQKKARARAAALITHMMELYR